MINDENASCFAPEQALSTREACDLYRQVLREHVLATETTTISSLSKNKRPRVEFKTGEDDCVSIFSDMDSLAAASVSDVDSYLSDVDSVAMRRHQMQPCISPCQVVIIESVSLDDAVTIDDDDDLDSLASSVDTLYSFDLDYVKESRDSKRRKTL